ncbi:restriction endonuclease [Aeromicrobium fastidiosum]|uniref:Restriction endonuclease n=1 Tax=Aeromicrobium fastidiosum TaxID=52699 RepID=A0A641AJG6_9ACTN|nr:restriction endonuclease [Aeromicrobium fastidiosum]KAA1375981.1 restriction endonuclease [Aeromicrobium fastidiosum]MBP2392157.1 hypothetical protein [Aeromicrobium fastidiosum]
MTNAQPSYVSTWQQAEENAAAWVRHWGWTDARVTETGPDGGIDVIGRGVVAQVKFKSSQTGAPDIQRLYGASYKHPGSQLIFFSGSSYSKKAIEVADEIGIALYTYDIIGAITAINRAAHGVVARRAAMDQQPMQTRHRPVAAGARLRKVDSFAGMKIYDRRRFNRGTIQAVLAFILFCSAITGLGTLSETKDRADLAGLILAVIFCLLASVLVGTRAYRNWRGASSQTGAR